MQEPRQRRSSNAGAVHRSEASGKRFSMPLRRMEDVASHANPIHRIELRKKRHLRTVTAGVRHELKQQFDFLDKDGDGSISLAEFNRICINAARVSDEATLKTMSDIIAASDKDGNREMDFEEYLQLYTDLLNSKTMQDGGFNFSMFRRLRTQDEVLSWKVKLRLSLFRIPVQLLVLSMIVTYLVLSISVVGFSYLPDRVSEQDRLNSVLLAVQLLNNFLQVYYLLRLLTSNPSVYMRKTSHCFILFALVFNNLGVAALLLRNHFGGEDNAFASFVSYVYMYRAAAEGESTSPPSWCDYKMSSYRLLFEYQGFRDGEFEPVCHGIYTSVQIFNLVSVLFIAWQVLIDSPFTFRVLVSKNKQRYLDLNQEFDLDLTMITNRLIAMGVPVEWKLFDFEHLWRNPISEVKRFLDSGPPSTHYRIYNCCPECPYPASYFHYRVKPFDVQDHSPTGMQVIFEFLRDAKMFVAADPRNTIVIHCKAGKGRTGTLCCAWLLYTQKATCASEALELFAERRTDHIKTKKAKKKMIAVDTWSQVRLIHDLDCWLSSQDMYIDSPGHAEPPPELPATIHSVRLENLLVAKEEDNIWVDVEVVCPVWVNGQPGRVVGTATCKLQNGVHTFMQLSAPVQGDFRINVYRRQVVPDEAGQTRSTATAAADVAAQTEGETEFKATDLETGAFVPSERDTMEPAPPPPRPKSKKPCKAGKEPGLLFYIFAHTAFLDNSGTLLLSKHELGDTKLMKKLDLLDEGAIRVEYNTDLSALTSLEREAIQRMGVSEHQVELHVAADDLKARLDTLHHVHEMHQHHVPHVPLPFELLKRIRANRHDEGEDAPEMRERRTTLRFPNIYSGTRESEERTRFHSTAFKLHMHDVFHRHTFHRRTEVERDIPSTELVSPSGELATIASCDESHRSGLSAVSTNPSRVRFTSDASGGPPEHSSDKHPGASSRGTASSIGSARPSSVATPNPSRVRFADAERSPGGSDAFGGAADRSSDEVSERPSRNTLSSIGTGRPSTVANASKIIDGQPSDEKSDLQHDASFHL